MTSRTYVRTIHPNGTRERYEETLRVRHVAAGAGPNRRALLVSNVREGTTDGDRPSVTLSVVYVAQTTFAVVVGRDRPDFGVGDRRVAGVDAPARPIYPGMTGPVDPAEQLPPDLPDDPGRGWSVVADDGDRVVYRTTDPRTVIDFGGVESFVDPSNVTRGNVTVAVDADTGRLRRVAAYGVRPRVDENGSIAARKVWTFEYEDVDLDRPNWAERRPVELLLDAVFY